MLEAVQISSNEKDISLFEELTMRTSWGWHLILRSWLFIIWGSDHADKLRSWYLIICGSDHADKLMSWYLIMWRIDHADRLRKISQTEELTFHHLRRRPCGHAERDFSIWGADCTSSEKHILLTIWGADISLFVDLTMQTNWGADISLCEEDLSSFEEQTMRTDWRWHLKLRIPPCRQGRSYIIWHCDNKRLLKHICKAKIIGF